MPFEITGSIFGRDDSQSQAPTVRKRPGVIEATIYHILNEEMGQIALNVVGVCLVVSEFPRPSRQELSKGEPSPGAIKD